MRSSTPGCSRWAACCVIAGDRTGVGDRAGRRGLHRCGRRPAPADVAASPGDALDRRRPPRGGDDQRPRRRRSTRPAAHAAPRARPLAVAAGRSRAAGAAPRSRVLPGRVRPVPPPRPGGRRCAPSRRRALPERPGPRGGHRGSRRQSSAGCASCPAPVTAATPMASPRARAPGPPRARRALARMRHVPPAHRGTQPRADPSGAPRRASPAPGCRASLTPRRRRLRPASRPARGRWPPPRTGGGPHRASGGRRGR